MIAWWEAQLKTELSQGDILELVYVPVPGPTPLFLRKGTAKNNIPAWFDVSEAVAEGGKFPTRQNTLPIAVIVVSHDCELDKQKPRVLVAPVATLDSIERTDQERILGRKVHSKLPLLAMPVFGACFADFRSITALDRRYVDNAKRVASMSQSGVEQLQHQLIAAFTRLDFGAGATTAG